MQIRVRLDGTPRPAWLLRKELKGECGRTAQAVKVSVTAVLMLCLIAAPAFAVQPDHAVYSGGTAGVGKDTAGWIQRQRLRLSSSTGMPMGRRGRLRCHMHRS
jgi:hypothetical protein